MTTYDEAQDKMVLAALALKDAAVILKDKETATKQGTIEIADVVDSIEREMQRIRRALCDDTVLLTGCQPFDAASTTSIRTVFRTRVPFAQRVGVGAGDEPMNGPKPYREPSYQTNPERTAEQALELALKELRAGKLFRAMHATDEAARKVALVWETNQ